MPNIGRVSQRLRVKKAKLHRGRERERESERERARERERERERIWCNLLFWRIHMYIAIKYLLEEVCSLFL